MDCTLAEVLEKASEASQRKKYDMSRFQICGTGLLCSTLLILTASLQAQNTKPAAAKPAKPNPAFQAIEDDPSLPRVLLIGDSISIGYTIPVRELLKGKANVHRPATNCGPSKRGVEQIDAWLGDKKWDVIHFNFGLHDLRYMDDKTVKPGPLDFAPSGRETQVSLADYEKNLTTIVERLQKTGAKLIWCSTTPVPKGAVNRVPGSEKTYNDVAAKVMKAHQIQINDLYAFAVPQLEQIQRAKDVHYTPEGSRILAKEVAGVIEAALPAQAKK